MANEPQQLADGAIDPNVRLPKHITDAAKAADALHQQLYTPPADPGPNIDPVPEPAPAPDVTATVTNQDPPPLQPQPTENTDNFTAPAGQDLKDSAWAGRYNSMRGRWEASQRQLGVANQQLADLAVELAKTQELLARAGVAAPQPANSDTPQNHNRVIGTEADRETYGEELLDTVARTARQAIAPELDALRGENADLKKRVTSVGQKEAKIELTRAVPNWVAINRDPGFNAWLSLPNIYSGVVRRQVLNEAYNSADAQKMVSIFQDFIREVQATGGVVPGTRTEQPQPQPQPQQQQPAPRSSAVDPLTLAAPGRARPSGGDNLANPTAEKPTYTRAAISNFYRNVRLARSANPSGPYVGREADIAAIEADLIAAQSEGRVRG